MFKESVLQYLCEAERNGIYLILVNEAEIFGCYCKAILELSEAIRLGGCCVV